MRSGFDAPADPPLCTLFERGPVVGFVLGRGVAGFESFVAGAGLSVGCQPLIVSFCTVTIRSLRRDHSTGDVAIAEESREVCGFEALDCHCRTQDERQP
jgi:hypothetical protein